MRWQKNNTYNLKHKEEYEFYHSYNKPKCSYTTYMQRIHRWIKKEKAIIKKQLKIRSEYTTDWRVCMICWQFKQNQFFHRDKHSSLWISAYCKDCKNKKHRENRKNIEYKEKERIYRKQYNQSERWKQINSAYYLYLKEFWKNLEILKKLWEKPKKNEVKNIKKDIIKRLKLENKFNLII